MQKTELQALTVLELRKIAKANGVKLSAGISKEGIVDKLAEALADQSVQTEAALEADMPVQTEAASEADMPEENDMGESLDDISRDLQNAALAADVTNVAPRSQYSGAWGQRSAQENQGFRAQTNRSAWQARMSAQTAPRQQPAWQQRPAGPTRFGPQSSHMQSAPDAEPMRVPPDFSRQEAYQPQSRAQEQPPRMEGYRLGYRAAPQRQNDYYRNAPRQEQRYQQRVPYNPPAQQAPSDAYYNSSVYKPTRDPSFDEPYDGVQRPDMLQAGEGDPVNGVLEILPDGYGFLRAQTLLPGKRDIYVSVAQIRRYSLRTGDYVTGRSRPQRDYDKFAALLFVETVNGQEPEENPNRITFEELTPIYPNKRISLESENSSENMPVRLVDLIAPIGFGQRAMIIAPPESGKSVLLKDMAVAIKKNDESAYVMMLLIDVRPEEATEIRDAVDAEIYVSTFDEAPENQVRIAETMLERSERLVESKKNVVILLDSLTKLTRAYQASLMQGGRVMNNTVTPAALVRPKRFFGAARNTRDGGSLTMIATISVETGSRMDDIIYEEFKGTANMELFLEAPAAGDPMFPIINLQKSGTRKDGSLLTEQEQEGLRAIRTVLGSTTNREALVQLIGMMEKTKCNADLFGRLKDWIVLWEKSGYLQKK